MKMLEELEGQDKDGNQVEFESEAFGCKVTGKVYRPDMVLIGDKVGGNLDVNGNGHTGGEKVIYEKGCIAQKKLKKQNISQLLVLQTYLVNIFVAL